MDMTYYNDLLVSASDAETLATLVGDRRRTNHLEAAAADALADMLMDARMVPHDRLPVDRVAMNCEVTYLEEPGGARRSVARVHPGEAAPSQGLVSVLSPVGRALLGRKRGSVVPLSVPGGKAIALRILDVERAHALEAR
jgi:regulator of nucleoside diphosphate kinase